MSARTKIWFHRSRAIAWIIVGILSFVFGWQNSVVLVWIASVYANTVSDWGASEAADDRDVTGRIDEVNVRLDRIEVLLKRGDDA
jgi:hypothetical protein